jgi:RNA polymerase sigma factor (sigma-70 family)
VLVIYVGVDSDADLLRVAVRDHGAFDVVYRRHRRAVATYVARRIGAEGVEDVTAEVFVRAFRARAGYTPGHDSALPWLLGIASRVLSEQRRRERRRLQTLERLVRERPRAAVDTEDTSVDADLIRTLRRLPASDRDTLLLVSWGELSYAEAATALGVPVGTVRSRIARARRRLVLALDPEQELTTLQGQNDV